MRLLSLLLVLFSLQSQAATNCTEYLRREGAFQLQRMETDQKACFLGIDPFNVPDSFFYRSYLLTDEGLLMVFNSFGTDEGAHGARVFYFFPRQLDPDMKVRHRGQISIQTATPGIELIFSTDETRILGMRGGQVKESSQVSPSNSGGLEFSHVQTLFLDAGFAYGQDPTGLPNRNSKFIDVRGQTCEVKNAEIFKYTSDGDSIFRFSDTELKNFLSTRCPNLQVNF